MRVLIIGAGVMGSASALELARAGCEVVLLDRAVPGAEASSAAAGMLGAQLESEGPGPDFDAFIRAREKMAAWSEQLLAETGVHVGHRVSGALHLATDDEEARRLTKTVEWQREAHARAEIVDSAGARAIEPHLAQDIVAAAYFPDEAQLEPAMLLRALAVAVARIPTITVKTGTTVHEIEVDRSEGRARATGVRLSGETLRGDAVVLAAGSWSSLVGGASAAVPEVRPARGQLVEVEERPPRLRTILAGGGAYVVPRGDGRVVCGSTVEFVGFRREVTVGGLHRILGGALRLAPGLAEAEVGRSWSSFRPYSTTKRPLVGKTEIERLVLATGHHRNGILLSKSTAEAVREAVLGTTVS